MMAMVNEVLARRSQSSLVGPSVRTVLSADQVMESYAAMARRSAARASAPPSSSSPSLPSEGRGYASSVHVGETGPPAARRSGVEFTNLEPWTPQLLPPLPEDSLTELTHKQLQRRKTRQEIDASLVRMRDRAKEGR